MKRFGSIPVRNIWLLYLYAMAPASVSDATLGHAEAARDIPGLMGGLLCNAVELRLKRSLNSAYRPEQAVLTRVRERIDLLQTRSRRLMDKGQVYCRFEELTRDTPRNRLVRAALDHVSVRVDKADIADRARRLSIAMGHQGVSRGRPSRAELARDTMGRNETADRMMVSLARMVFELMIPAELAGHRLQPGDATTERAVRQLFERAIGNALRLELAPKGWKVRTGRRLLWPVGHATPEAMLVLPGMKTDIELDHAGLGSHIVIDTKFTSILTRSQYRDAILKSAHLYQLYAYLRTQEDSSDPIGMRSEGMLLYPSAGLDMDHRYEMQGHGMTIRTIDLALPPDQFEQQISQLISWIGIKKEPLQGTAL